jgi:hypothetical protein
MMNNLENYILFLIFVVWTTIWKGIALWKAARLSHKKWFIAILILNTAGILDILYIYFFSERKVKNNKKIDLINSNSEEKNKEKV